jgi:protein O-mannosyl-transferase
MGRYLLLLFFPHPLSSDYSYNQIPLADWSYWEPWASLIVYLAIAVLIVTRFRKKEIMVFGLLFFLISISLYSNIFFLVGSTLGERFLYTPSFGICLFVAGGLSILLKNKPVGISESLLSAFKKGGPVPYLFLVVCLLLSIKTWSRNQDWADNLTLWGRDITVVPYNARMHYWYGNEVMIRLANPETDPALKTKFYDTALSHLNRAIEILPDYHDALLGRGMYYYRQRKMDLAEADFRLSISNGKGSWSVMNNLGVIYAERNQLDSAYKYFKLAYKLGPQEAAVNKSMGDYYSVNNQVDSALFHYQKAVENIEADEQKLLPEIYGYMEELYRFKGDSLNTQRYRLLLQGNRGN